MKSETLETSLPTLGGVTVEKVKSSRVKEREKLNEKRKTSINTWEPNQRLSIQTLIRKLEKTIKTPLLFCLWEI